MTLSINALRKAVYSLLSQRIPATPTYSYTPPDSAFPYIRIGEIYASDAGTKTEDALDYEVTLHLFDKGEGSTATIEAMAQSVRDAMHWQEAFMSITGCKVVKCHMSNMNVMQQGDIADYYWHAVMRFSITVEAL